MGANWFGRLLQVGANWFGILRKLLAFSGPGYFLGFGCMGRGNWAGYVPGIPHFYYRLLPIVIASGLKAIFLIN
jgi:manganese transport protein